MSSGIAEREECQEVLLGGQKIRRLTKLNN
jgi:hypothetical protein